MRRLVSFAPLAIVVGCSHPAPPSPPPAELAAASAADLQGEWVTSDDFDWGYHLSITGGGAITLAIDRGKLGRCEQRGTLTPTADHVLALALPHDTCTAPTAEAPTELRVASLTGKVLTIAMPSGGVPNVRTYRRAHVEHPVER